MGKPTPLFIAEVKTQSPFGFVSRHSWLDLFNIANRVGDAVGVHTSPEFGGSFELLATAVQSTKKHIVAKGFHYDRRDIERCFEIGAALVFQVGGIPLNDHRIMYEPTTDEELRSALQKECTFVVLNSRDLTTGQRVDPLLPHDTSVSPNTNLIQASFISKPEHIQSWADGFIVGTFLPEFAQALK